MSTRQCAEPPAAPTTTVRCLVLSPWVPYPPHDGGRTRIYELLRALREQHEVDVLSLCEPGPAADGALAALRSQGFSIEAIPHRSALLASAIGAASRRSSLYAARFRAPAFGRALAQRLRSVEYDIVQCEFPYMAQYRDAAAPARPRWVLDEHNVEFRLNATLEAVTAPGLRGAAYRAYARRELRLRRAEELAACRAVDHVIAVSEIDRALLESELPGARVSVVPNGVDLERFRPGREDGDEHASGAVFVGKMDYRPNIDAVRWFCAAILPLVRAQLPDFVYTIVGRSPSAAVRQLERLDGVQVTGEVPDTRPYLRRAAAVTVPLRAGSGTRLKVLEALAMGCAVVSTSLGCEGLDTIHDEHVLLADEPESFAHALVELCGDAPRRLRLGGAGRRLIEREYGWGTVSRRLAGTYAGLLEPAAGARGRT